MNPYFVFSDECGNYVQIRNEKFYSAHPFYVRSTVIISMNDYIALQEGVTSIKQKFGLLPQTEVKWSHYGSSIKGNYKKIPHTLTPQQLNDYFTQCLILLCSLESVMIYYTFTENKAIGKIDEIALYKMHLQNAYQRVQAVMASKDGYAIFIIDDLSDKNKALKQAAYQMTLTGDYVQYTNIKKGLYIDFSDQCHGLQMADLCAGIFTASLKHESVLEKERSKFQMGFGLFFDHVYKKVRHISLTTPYSEVYGYGVKEVPKGAGRELAKKISRQIEKNIDRDFMQEIHEMFDQD